MTEEELAKEYADRMADQYLGLKEDNGGYVNIKEAFLAGYRAGKPKRHKVADGDLPKDPEPVLCVEESGEYSIGEYWTLDGWGKNRKFGEEVVAWCELPKFEE